MGERRSIGGVQVYLSEPDGPPRGAVIVLEEIWGLVDHILDIADRFAAEGYLAVAPDLLADIGITPQAGTELMALRHEPDEAKRLAGQPRLRAAYSPLGDPDFAAATLARLRAVVDDLAERPDVRGRIAVVGYCFGGTYAFSLAAADARVRGCVPFYGQAPEDDRLAGIACPVLAFYGDRDERLMAALPHVREAMAAAGVDFTAQVYEGVGHAFFNDTSPTTYDAATAADAWRRTLDHLAGALA